MTSTESATNKLAKLLANLPEDDDCIDGGVHIDGEYAPSSSANDETAAYLLDGESYYTLALLIIMGWKKKPEFVIKFTIEYTKKALSEGKEINLASSRQLQWLAKS